MTKQLFFCLGIIASLYFLISIQSGEIFGAVMWGALLYFELVNYTKIQQEDRITKERNQDGN